MDERAAGNGRTAKPRLRRRGQPSRLRQIERPTDRWRPPLRSSVLSSSPCCTYCTGCGLGTHLDLDLDQKYLKEGRANHKFEFRSDYYLSLGAPYQFSLATSVTTLHSPAIPFSNSTTNRDVGPPVQQPPKLQRAGRQRQPIQVSDKPGVLPLGPRLALPWSQLSRHLSSGENSKLNVEIRYSLQNQ